MIKLYSIMYIYYSRMGLFELCYSEMEILVLGLQFGPLLCLVEECALGPIHTTCIVDIIQSLSTQ